MTLEDEEQFDLSKLDFSTFQSRGIKQNGIKSTKVFGIVKPGIYDNYSDTLMLNDSIYMLWETTRYDQYGRDSSINDMFNYITFEYDSIGLIAKKAVFQCFLMEFQVDYQYFTHERKLFQIWNNGKYMDTTVFWFNENFKVIKEIGHSHTTSTPIGIYVSSYNYLSSNLVSIQSFDSIMPITKGELDSNSFQIQYSKNNQIIKTTSKTFTKNKDSTKYHYSSGEVSYYDNDGLIDKSLSEGKTIVIYRHNK